MIFSGQGAQWPEMGRELILQAPNFREDIREMDNTLQTLTHRPEWTIEGEILRQPVLKRLLTICSGASETRGIQQHQSSGISSAALYSDPDRHRKPSRPLWHSAESCHRPLQWRDSRSLREWRPYDVCCLDHLLLPRVRHQEAEDGGRHGGNRTWSSRSLTLP